MSAYNNYSDSALLPLVAQSDEAAFTVLFERYRNRLYYYIVRHTKHAEIAEEIVTDIFMKLWTGRELALQINDLPAFLHKVAYYKALDFLRTTARHASLKKIYMERLDNAGEKMPDEIMIQGELKALLLAAVNQLPPQRKLIYRLSREEGLSHEQIAKALNISRNTVNNTLVVASRSVSDYIKEQALGNAALSALFLMSHQSL